MSRPSRVVPAVALAVLAIVVTACSAGRAPADPPIEGADSTVDVTGQDNLTWDNEALTASAGLVEVVLTCGTVNHNFVIDETGEEVVACRPRQTRRGAVELEPGTYGFLCAVPGHDHSMRGTLTVEG